MATMKFTKTAGLLEPAVYAATISKAYHYNRNGNTGMSLTLEIEAGDKVVKLSDIIFDNLFESKKRSFFAVLEEIMSPNADDEIVLEANDDGNYDMLIGRTVAVDIKIEDRGTGAQNKVNAYRPVSTLE